jgi:hypothetical protein
MNCLCSTCRLTNSGRFVGNPYLVRLRLSKSKYRAVFILKEALLFDLWTKERHRPTRDADFQATGDNSPDRFARIFQDLSAFEFLDDALRFDAKTVNGSRMRS